MGSEDQQIRTPATVLTPKSQYTSLLMQGYGEFAKLCASSLNPGDLKLRVSYLIRIMINFIPNPVERTRLKAMREDQIKGLKKKFSDLTDRGEAVFELDCEILGEIMQLSDDILGIHERQVIIGTQPLSELERKFYPHGYTMDINDDIDQSGEVVDEDGGN